MRARPNIHALGHVTTGRREKKGGARFKSMFSRASVAHASHENARARYARGAGPLTIHHAPGCFVALQLFNTRALLEEKKGKKRLEEKWPRLRNVYIFARPSISRAASRGGRFSG